MKRVLSALIVLIFSLSLFAQNRCFVVKDSISKLPIPYCNIVFAESQAFVSNHKGAFCINSSHKKAQTLKVSNIAYQPIKISIDSYSDSIIYMNPKSYQLSDIEIKWDNYKFYWVGNTFNKPDSYKNLWRFCQLGIYVAPLKKGEGILEQVNITLQNFNGEKGPFRLHVLAADSLGNVGKELLPENVFGQLKENESMGIVSLNILKYQIKIPESGVYVSVELLSNSKKEELQFQNGKKYYEQHNNRIGMTKAKYRDRKTKKLSSWKPGSYYVENFPFTNVPGIYGEVPMIKVKVRKIKK